MLEILLWVLVVSYVAAVCFAVAENLACKRTLTRGWQAKARVALEGLAWPAEESWLQLRHFCVAQWRAAVPRYADLP